MALTGLNGSNVTQRLWKWSIVLQKPRGYGSFRPIKIFLGSYLTLALTNVNYEWEYEKTIWTRFNLYLWRKSYISLFVSLVPRLLVVFLPPIYYWSVMLKKCILSRWRRKEKMMHKPGPNCITDAFCVNDAPLCCDDSCFPGRSPRGLWSGSSGSDHRWNSVAYSQNFSVCDGKCSENLNSVIASIWKIPYFEKDKPKGKIYLLVIKRLFKFCPTFQRCQMCPMCLVFQYFPFCPILHTLRNLHFLSKNSTLISRDNRRFFWVKNS